jgi:glycosyltransferase involved in cell wall biosynthesis
MTRETSWFWDTEVLVLAGKIGYSVGEVPVTWREMKTRRTPLGRLLSDVFLHGKGLLKLWSRLHRGGGHGDHAIQRSTNDSPTIPAVYPEGPMSRKNLRQPLLLVNNHGQTGIGDFGFGLLSHLNEKGVHAAMKSTPVNWSGFTAYLHSVLSHKGGVIYNVGLTAWGDSPLRNFLGLLTIGLRHGLGHGDLILLHNVIEAIDTSTAGYRISGLVRFGAHFAVRQLKGVSTVVFSRRMRDLLRSRYGIEPLICHPLPVELKIKQGNSERSLPNILAIGYLSPYKGYDLLFDAIKLIASPMKVVIAGDEHRLLKPNPDYQEFVAGLREKARVNGITLLPKVPEEDLPRFMSEIDIGVLPYAACQGACAAASLLIAYQIPILASDLPEFRELHEAGCGIVLSSRKAPEFAERLTGLLEDKELLMDLRTKQTRYAEQYSWSTFTDLLLDQFRD